MPCKVDTHNVFFKPGICQGAPATGWDTSDRRDVGKHHGHAVATVAGHLIAKKACGILEHSNSLQI